MVLCRVLFFITLFGNAAAAVFKDSQTGLKQLLKMAPVVTGRSRTRLKKKSPRKNITPVVTNPVCCFCCRTEDDIERYGEWLIDAKTNLSAHYYCLILSSGLWQEGKEDEGFYGFLIKDIKKEVERASTIKCCICNRLGASINCELKKCSKSFHYPCGEEKQCLFQFFDRFRSYCWEHVPVQKAIPTKSKTKCPVCLETIQPKPNFTVLKSPCCKQTWFHRRCLQKSALASGLYHFRCAICCNKDKFVKEMLRMGIHIPERDAAWELEDNAYSELYEVRRECDVPKCLSKKGRKYNNPSSKWNKWNIVLCHYCGLMGTHLVCSALSNPNCKWICSVCFPIASTYKSQRAGSSSQKPPARPAVNSNVGMNLQRTGRATTRSRNNVRAATTNTNQTGSLHPNSGSRRNVDETNSLQRLRGCYQIQTRTRRDLLRSAVRRDLR